MFKPRSTPFDKPADQRPLLRFLVHAASLKRTAASDPTHVQKLLALSHFDLFEVLVTPTSDPEVLGILSEAGLNAAQVVSRESSWILIFDNGSQLVGPVQTGIDYAESIVDGSQVSWLDFIMARNLDDFDYFVVGYDDPFLDSRSKRSKDLSIREAMERARLIAANSGAFQIRPDYTVDESFYYLYRFKTVFRSFQKPYSAAVLGGALPPGAREQLESLAQRLELLCRAADQASFYALKRAGNHNQDRTLYHSAFLISLITGVFEDLALLLVHIYSLPTKSKYAISLRQFSNNKPSEEFFADLQGKNPILHAYLTDPVTQTSINLFFPVRNRLHHGLFIEALRYLDQSNDVDSILFVIPHESVQLMEALDGPNSHKLWGIHPTSSQYFIEPHRLASRAFEVTALIVNSFLDCIEWEQMVVTLPTEAQERVRESWIEFDQGVAHFLHWGVEPIYF